MRIARDWSNFSDDELLAALRAEADEAVRELMRRYDRLVRYTIYRAARRACLRDPQWLDGVASEVWSGLIQSLRGSAPPGRKLKPYLIQITRNKCTDAARRERCLETAAADIEGTAEPAEPVQDDPLELISRVEDLSLLRECIAGLPGEQRRLCGEIVAIMGHRWREAAERLGMAESTLRSKWQGVTESLQRCMHAKKRAG